MNWICMKCHQQHCQRMNLVRRVKMPTIESIHYIYICLSLKNIILSCKINENKCSVAIDNFAHQPNQNNNKLNNLEKLNAPICRFEHLFRCGEWESERASEQSSNTCRMNCDFTEIVLLTFEKCGKTLAKRWNALSLSLSSKENLFNLFSFPFYFVICCFFCVCWFHWDYFLPLCFVLWANPFPFGTGGEKKTPPIEFDQKEQRKTNKKKLKMKINLIVQEHTFSILFFEQKSSQ